MSNREGYWKEYKRPPEYFVKAAEAQRQRRKNNPEKYKLMGKTSERNRKLKKYGLTKDQYDLMLNAQNFVCAVCKQPNNTTRDWHIDHDHKTGIVRGILCHHCNLMLGNAKDSPETLKSAVQYLESFTWVKSIS